VNQLKLNVKAARTLTFKSAKLHFLSMLLSGVEYQPQIIGPAGKGWPFPGLVSHFHSVGGYHVTRRSKDTACVVDPQEVHLSAEERVAPES
jgi:hypothetical protein